jgi:hypothetical protein
VFDHKLALFAKHVQIVVIIAIVCGQHDPSLGHWSAELCKAARHLQRLSHLHHTAFYIYNGLTYMAVYSHCFYIYFISVDVIALNLRIPDITERWSDFLLLVSKYLTLHCDFQAHFIQFLQSNAVIAHYNSHDRPLPQPF